MNLAINLYRKICVTGAVPDEAGGLSAPVTTWEYGDRGQVESALEALQATFG